MMVPGYRMTGLLIYRGNRQVKQQFLLLGKARIIIIKGGGITTAPDESAPQADGAIVDDVLAHDTG